MSFGGDLDKFAKSTGIRMDQVVRKVTIDVTRDLVLLTPVETGAARSNYFFGFTPPTATDTSLNVEAHLRSTGKLFTASFKERRKWGRESAKDKSGSRSNQRAAEFAVGLKAGGVFYIVNNLPYILPIVEYGHSKQAAPGAVTRLVARWQNIVDGAVRGTRDSRVEFGKGL